MSPKYLVLFSVLLVAAHAVKPRLGYNIPNLGLNNARIVGGDDAEKGEFPHQVSLQWGMPPFNGYQHFCGGSIIDSKWILTAGHCVHAVPNYGSFVVKAGKHNVLINENNEQVTEVSATFVHDKYIGDVAPYDIALLRLKTPLKMNSAVSPISLPKRGAKPTGNSILSGWGSISPKGDVAPAILQKVVLPIIDLVSCGSLLDDIIDSAPLHSTNVCTGSSNDQISACNGDSGGPLIVKNDYGANEVIGVVSWGLNPCGVLGSPSVYVDVAQFIDWIKDTMRYN